ncbi:helix-turn-helix domain-containing protein [Candidatus Uhrbacteria bacterium]|nr:helix-turn-helix domain-containing protein [Candidatus Uhrbacteria bacterium]
MSEELTDILVESGLSPKEAAIYLAACELGPAGVQEIANKSGIQRTTVYVCLETLEKEGFISGAEAAGRKVFVAAPPDHVLSTVRAKREAIVQKEEKLASALPRLTALYNVEGQKPQVLFMEGQEGLMSQLDVFEKLVGPFIQITNIDDAAEAFKGREQRRKEHKQQLKEQEVGGRTLVVTSKSLEELQLLPMPVDLRFLPFENFPIHGEVTVREDTILLYSFRGQTFVTIIRSKTMADTLRSVFELAWSGARIYPGLSSQERLAGFTKPLSDQTFPKQN